ncbi:hypothetical protein HBH98_231690 [Parastagonospora nodorum]|nr:hypothetical protein HBH53_234700 [Parastagonospora nodorum]KAH4152463.1 hypothetical protein HBH43_233830 [Parastagonospora nodorum]KAH4284931.1 hypothetical protein HBI02_238860 [Parastagonospora nodorum]KAH4286434.1 hypothetical protein HBI01_239040 [Parastagonospora nodorum]KAH4319990.1 hypothetical protein HBI00_233680 [Parastagonospora nodorum]
MALSTLMLLCAHLYLVDFCPGGSAALSWLPRVTTVLLAIPDRFIIISIAGAFLVWCYMITPEPIGVLAKRMKTNAQALHPQYVRFEILMKRMPDFEPAYATTPSRDSWEGSVVGYDKNNNQHTIAFVPPKGSSSERDVIKQHDRVLAEKVRVNGPKYQLHT